MSDDNEKPPKKCERFHSLQNFWRKLCYNLGRSGNCEAEVRVVTCIPIDVSQLQERIQTLEWEIANKRRRAKEPPATDVRASLFKQIFKPLSTEAPHITFKEFPPLDYIKEDPEMECSQHRVPIENSKIVTPQQCSVIETIDKLPSISRHTAKSTKVYRDQEYFLSRPSKINDKIKTERKPTKSKKVKKSNENRKGDINNKHALVPLIYYAQTVGSPFRNSGPCNQTSTYQQDSISHAYLEEMIRKQYKPEPLINNSYSQFSTPVCREIDGHCHNAYPNDSDICSCCRGKFQNLDHEHRARKRNRLQDPFLKCIYSSKRDTVHKYYNSNDYDIVPVKELPISKKLCRKEPRPAIDVMCCPENIRIKPKLYYWLENHPTIATSKIHHLQDSPIHDYELNLSKNTVKYSRKIERAKINTATESVIPQNEHASYDTQLISSQTREIKSSLQKNVGCLTLNCNNIECQTVTTKSIQLDPIPIRDINNKTEVTLGEIKCILQTVLSEVKNNQIKNVSEEKLTRDAVKKEVSQNTMTSSSKLIQSCTYSPYNMCPYMPPYSYPYQLPSGPLCCPSMPFATLKCLQNYPVLVKTPQRIYNSIYKEPKVTRSVCTINETDVTTNTEPDNNERDRETNKLIEDIYKSLDINLKIPSKDVTCNQALKKKSEQLIMRNPNTEVCERVNVGAVNYKIEDFDAPTKSAVVNNDVNNMESATLDMINRLKTDTVNEILKLKNSETHCNDKYNENVQNNEKLLTINFRQSDDCATLTAYSETSESESENEEALSIVESIKKNPKKGLFSKMINSVKMFRMKGDNKIAQDSGSESENESDNSEDYETVIVEPKTTKYTNRPRITIETKDTSNRHYRGVETNPKIVSTPYKRENRRHWEEQRMPYNYSTGIYQSAHGESLGPHVITGRPVYKFCQDSEAGHTLINKPHLATYNSPNTRNATLKEKKIMSSKDSPKTMAWLRKKNCFKCAPEWKKLMLS